MRRSTSCPSPEQEDARPCGLADCDPALVGLDDQMEQVAVSAGLQRDEVAVLEFAVPLDTPIDDASIEGRADGDPTRPVDGAEGHLEGGEVRPVEADEAAPRHERLSPRVVPHVDVVVEFARADPEFVPVRQDLNGIQIEEVSVFDAERERKPVREVDQILVLDGASADLGRQAVVAAVDVRARVVDIIVRVRPRGRAPRAEVPVAERREGFPQAFLLCLESGVGPWPAAHLVSPVRR